MTPRARTLFFVFLAAILPALLHAELTLPALFSDHMVLQRRHANPIWGWDDPGTKITVTLDGQKHSATAGADGKWMVRLEPMEADGRGRLMVVEGTRRLEIRDVLVGEVWVCSGQSNMQWALRPAGKGGDFKGDLEAAASNYPALRLITVPHHGTQVPQDHFKGEWLPATPDTVARFSAVGFFFGRYLHQVLNVPVGLIHSSWGGSAAEAWVPRAALESDSRFAALMEDTRKEEAHNQSPIAVTEFEAAHAKWKLEVEKAKAEMRKPPSEPRPPGFWLFGNKRAGNLYNGMIHPLRGYGAKGIIWYQGETNASRAHEYAELFPFLIERWRAEWQVPDLSFYWVQLANFKEVSAEPAESDWAELREAQTRTMRLPHTGQAVVIDLGEGRDIHPRNKLDVAARLVRWALAKDYGVALAYRSPEYKSFAVDGGRATVTFDCFGSELRPFGTDAINGFAVCGDDGVWRWASARLSGPDKVEVWNDSVAKPVAVRYAWSANPGCNLQAENGLPVTPFRTDDFAWTTKRK